MKLQLGLLLSLLIAGTPAIDAAEPQSVKELSFSAPNNVTMKLRMEGPYTAESFSRDGKRLAILDQQRGALVFMDSATRRTERELVLEHWPSRGPAKVALNADQNVLAEAIGNGTVVLYDTRTKQATELQSTGNAIFDHAGGLTVELAEAVNCLPPVIVDWLLSVKTSNSALSVFA